MNINTHENAAVGLNARDFLGGYLRKEDLDEERTVTITDVRAELVPGKSRRKLVVEFRELEKPLILNSTNIKRLVSIFDTTNASLWRGQISLYVDEAVEFGGCMVGGIRVQRASARSKLSTVATHERVNGGIAA